jgi:hypothetical protein
VRQIETTAQFRFGFLAKRHQRVSRRNGLYKNVFDILSESKEDELVEREELCAEVTG